ncbi:hypothetical protein [Ruminococcus flavefaciens]|uniref:Uncharacterized protein n=1 Tax=Ruminococcus flavefaciens TaxID=1265 RepID=A0A1M7MPK7_RUMFL|nr:hypothetical protein [Ruminococcus flavefaciens]SHM92439.1 hypothetical protein SAMN04487860_1254 [Ruminococcus flavefaciens]
MQRNDYKDALNELQLSSKFCEEMEKKLTESNNVRSDEYEDIVTHVDVIKPKRFRGLATAAAFVLAAGGIGGGAYYKINAKYNSGPQSEQQEYDEYNCNFPFATLPLHDVVFNVCDRAIRSSVPAYDKIAKNLDDFFEHAEWTELSDEDYNVDRNTYAGIDFLVNEYIVHIQSNEKVYVSKRLINLNDSVYYTDDYDYITADGLYVINGQSENYEYFKYSLPEGSYKKILSILLEDRVDTNADFCGVSGSFINADYHTSKEEGKVTELQAYSLSYLLNNAIWTTETEGFEEDTEKEPITLNMVDNKDHYEIKIYRNGITYITKTTEESNAEEVSKQRFKDKDAYNDLLSTLTTLDESQWIVPCPIDFKKENAVLIKKTDGVEKAYLIDGYSYDSLALMLENFEWTRCDDVYNNAFLSDGTYMPVIDKDKIAQNDNSFTIVIGAQAIVINDNNMIYSSPYRYGVTDIDHSIIDVWVQNNNFQDMSDDEFVDWAIDNVMQKGEMNTYYSIYSLDQEAGPQEVLIKDIEENREKLKALEWTKLNNPEFFDDKNIACQMYNTHLSVRMDKNGIMKLGIGDNSYYFSTSPEQFAKIADGLLNYK